MRKDPMLACLLNLLLVGTGHMYLGRVAKGLSILGFAIVLAIFTCGIGTVILMIWAMYDAYGTAKRMNQSADRKTAADKI